MSSNIRITRICQYCNKDFEARKTTSKTCSDSCAKMLYKQKKRSEKIDSSNMVTAKVLSRPIEELKAKEFLSVRDASKLMNCSRQTLYTLINNGTIKAVNLATKKTIIKRSEIDKLFT